MLNIDLFLIAFHITRSISNQGIVISNWYNFALFSMHRNFMFSISSKYEHTYKRNDEYPIICKLAIGMKSQQNYALEILIYPSTYNTQKRKLKLSNCPKHLPQDSPRTVFFLHIQNSHKYHSNRFSLCNIICSFDKAWCIHGICE